MTTLGDLTQRITIEQRTVTADPLGGEVVAWVAAFRVDAMVLYGSGIKAVESFQQKGIVGASAASFRILNRKGLQPRQRVLYNGQVWDIKAINPDSKRKFMDLVCVQGLNDG